jgi:hypothetical protein
MSAETSSPNSSTSSATSLPSSIHPAQVVARGSVQRALAFKVAAAGGNSSTTKMSKAAAADRGRFWENDSESESGSGSDAGSESQEEEKRKVAAKAPVKRFAELEEESESDDEKRVVRTAKDKKWEAMLSIINNLRNQLRIHDWVRIEEGE